jgi:NarL family two-component system sensor histidine kinase LiaS
MTPGQWLVLAAILLGSGLVSILVAGFTGGYSQSRVMQEQMHTLVEATMLWANGRLGHRIEVLGEENEIHELAGALNGMAERLEDHVQALGRLVDKNERLAQRAATLATMEERQRLARDLHDSVSQQLFAIGMTAGAASKLYDRDAQRARPLIAQLEEMASKAQAEMRALLLHLRPIELEGRSLAEALDRFLQDVCPRHQIRYDMELNGIIRLSEGMEAHLFRIAQEAVSNVIRHASAKRLTVKLAREGERACLSISDDGQGFDPKQSRGGSYGLQSIRERAEEVGGRLEVLSSPGQGTEMRVWVSLYGKGEGDRDEQHPSVIGR